MMVSPFDVAYCPDGCACRGSPPPYDWIVACAIVFVGIILMVSH